MSRLFESFGDGADEADSSIASSPSGEAESDTAADAFDGAFGAGETLSLLADEEPPALESEPPQVTRSLSLRDDEATNVPPGGLAAVPYTIPDFAKDTKDLEMYDDAKRRYERQQIASAETAIHTSFAQKRETLQREIKNGRTFEDERRATAMVTTRQYASAYPIHVDKRGVNPPTFWENLFSFGRAGKLYRAAFVAAEALTELRNAMRKREEQLGQLDDQMKRAIYLKEESIKKAMETEAGINEFHERPEIKPLFKRIEAVKKERADYAKRLERGVVTDEEQRDRAMAEQKLVPTELPIMGAIIAKVARFGKLSYFQLRDLEKNESLLSYDPRLDPLRNCVFDVYSVAGTVAAKLKRNDNGTAFRVADHFKACWRNQDKAEELYSQHRSALREDRGLSPMEPRNENEAEIIERLANLSQLVEGGSQARPEGAPTTSTGG
ncbi:MAG: hypothetical protein ABSH03_18910 [Candidatus Lustribacter sp.]